MFVLTNILFLVKNYTYCSYINLFLNSTFPFKFQFCFLLATLIQIQQFNWNLKSIFNSIPNGEQPCNAICNKELYNDLFVWHMINVFKACFNTTQWTLCIGKLLCLSWQMQRYFGTNHKINPSGSWPLVIRGHEEQAYCHSYTYKHWFINTGVWTIGTL